MTDDQPPITPPTEPPPPEPTPLHEPPPPPSHGPFAFPPPPDPNASWGPPPDQPQSGWGAPRAFYPLTIGRVFELTWSLYRFRFRTFAAIALVIMIPVSALVAVSSFSQVSSPDFIAEMSDISRGGQFDYWSSIVGQLPLSLAYGLIVGIMGLIVSGALAHATNGIFRGTATSASQALRSSLRKLATWIGIYVVIFAVNTVLVLIGVGAASVLFGSGGAGGFLPGPAAFIGLVAFVGLGAALVFLTVRWIFAAQAVMLESANAMTALRRSWKLVSGSGWRVLGYLLAFALLVGLIGGVLGAFITILLNPIRIVGLTEVSFDPTRLAVASFISSVLAGVLAPIPAIALTLLYFDLRFRKGEQVPEPGRGSVPE